METPEQPPVPAPAEAPASVTQPEPNVLHTLSTWIRDLIICGFISLFIILFVYQPVKVEGGSMEPGLEDQERIFINKLVYRFEGIERGDIIVFRYPRDTHKSFIKRVIGLPGDRIQMINDRLYINDKVVPRVRVQDYVEEQQA